MEREAGMAGPVQRGEIGWNWLAAAWLRAALLVLAGLVLATDASAWCNIGTSCNKSWSYRRKLLLNSAEGSNLADFPVLVVLTAPGRIDYAKTQSLGQDLRFVDSDDATLLDHEIERWTPGGTSYVWVRVPQVDGGSTTDFIWMYYGNPSAAAPPAAAAENTWDAGFRMVQHLEEQSGTHFDSTSFNTDSTSIFVEDPPGQGMAPGQIGGTDSFARLSQHNVEVVDNGSLDMADGDSFTVEAWVQTSFSLSWQVAFGKESRGVATDGEIMLWTNGGFARFWLDDDDGSPANKVTADSGTNIADGAWHYLVGRWDNGSDAADLWVDGLQVATDSGPLGAIATSTPGVIGDEGDGPPGGAAWDGLIDEVRVSKTFRPDEWIRAQNRSMRDNGFVTYGPEAAHCCGLGVTELQLPTHTIAVNGPNRFDIRFNEATGGGIDRFSDDEENPAVDLAGGDNPGLQQALFSDEVSFLSTGANTQGAELDLLEATPVRVKVRGEAFYQEDGGPNILAGLKAYGDYSVYGIGRTAIGWERQATQALAPTMQQLQTTVHWTDGVSPLDAWTAYSETLGPEPSPFSLGGGALSAGDNFVLAQSEQPGARTDFLTILSQDWANADQVFFGNFTAPENWEEVSWIDDGPAAPIAVGSERINLLTYFKPTTLASGGAVDAPVTSRANDYRTPSPTTIVGGAGAGWVDASENTATDPANVFFNEAEAAYVFDLNQTTGLSFAMDGSADTRHYPFFKIRQWRSFVEAPVVTFDPDGGGGAPAALLQKDVSYRAAVKPVARAHFAQDLLYHTTLHSQAAVDTTPQVGSPGTVNGAVTFTGARFGGGAEFNADGEYLTIPSAGNFDPAQGAIEFWYRPYYDYGEGDPDPDDHALFGYWIDGDNFFYASHDPALGGSSACDPTSSPCPDDGLVFEIMSGAGNYSRTVLGAGVGFPQLWRADDWVHLRFAWRAASVGPQRVDIYVNGRLATPSASSVGPDYPSPVGTEASFAIGDRGRNDSFTNHANGIIDEFHVYGRYDAPRPIAHGGLTSDSTEFLADASGPKNFSLVDFDPVGALVRGEYLYFGADAKFRGLNVSLATAGAGVAANAVLWQYWDGTRWSSLPGVTDQTDSFTKPAGTIFWVDPASWNQYSVNGGPDLYYVRASLTGGVDYSTPPVERVIKTDILLFQYCNDVTAANQTFAFAVPATTEVRLASFTASPAEASVLLEWRTASELRNLGFHVYRSLSQNGPWTRLTSSLIPGLGSSAVGQAYSLLDPGLVNGMRYFYRLEDVDASSKATSHGPVSAVPTAGASAGAEKRDGAGGSRNKKDAAPSSCPGWVVSAHAALVGPDAATASLGCTRHGDPEAVSLTELSRDARQATLELRTGGFYALHEPSGTVRVFVPGFDFPQDEQAAALPIRRVLTDAVVGRRVQLGAVRALELQGFDGLVPSSLGKAEMQVGRDGTVRAARRQARGRGLARAFPNSELVKLLPSLFQGEKKSAVLEIAPLRFDAQRSQLVLAKRVRVKLLFGGREPGESGRGSLGRAARPRKPAEPSGEVLARLHTTSVGLHAVTFEELFPAERRSVSVGELRLERQSEAVGFHVEPQSSGFGPGSRLYFHADRTASSTDFTGEVAYELRHSREGLQMPLVSAAPGATGVGSASCVSRVFETNRLYQPGLLEAEDLWLWEPLVSGVTRAKPFALSGVSNSGTAVLEVYLQGASESGQPVDHHVSVSLNGSPVGEARFAGRKPYRISLSVAASLLREGQNELVLTNAGDTGVQSLVYLDRFTLAHPQLSVLAGGRFEGTWAESGTVTVSGASSGLAVLDVTASGAGSSPRWLTGYSASGDELRFSAESGRRYLAVAQEALLSPRVEQPQLSGLRSAENQADYLLIAPPAFLAAAQPLVERRQDQGLVARAVAFEEIAAEFGHGQASAEAIKSFLAHAFDSWARPSPRYVLLLGDASYDPRNFSGTSQPSPLPALWTKTSYLWTASDPLLGAVNGEDGLPDLAIGRLPATTVEQAEALVQKLLAWEDSGQGLSGAATLVADNPDLAGDFEADVRDIAESYLAGRNPQLLLLRELGAGTRPAILDALNSGLSFLNYVGHGGAAVWASENVWNSWDAGSLQAQSRQPLLVTMNCLNGYFVAPSFDSLSESLLKAEGRGAIASFSPSGLSLDGPAHRYHRALMAELTSGRHQRLGDAILAAQKTYAESGLMPELLGVYHLLGDPATRVR